MDRMTAKFLKVLREQDMGIDADMERDAMEASLDDGTDPSDFDTDVMAQAQENNDEVADAMSRRNQQIIVELQSWIDEIESFLNFLNSEDPNRPRFPVWHPTWHPYIKTS
jgi:hypothetical protein